MHAVTWGVTAGTAVEHDDVDEKRSIVEVAKRVGMLVLVTLPWAIRKRFPVNSFSDNWKRNNVEMNNNNRHNDKGGGGIQVGTEKGSKYLWLINGMYRFKKWQYVFYKHVILHGLNISVAVTAASTSQHTNHNHTPLPLTPQWRTFWLLLNTSYVMEFFLQSLVKRKVLTQRYMMGLNFLLMISASFASMEYNVLGQVRVEAALISLVLNFWNRGHDVANTMVTFVIIYFFNQYRRI